MECKGSTLIWSEKMRGTPCDPIPRNPEEVEVPITTLPLGRAVPARHLPDVRERELEARRLHVERGNFEKYGVTAGCWEGVKRLTQQSVERIGAAFMANGDAIRARTQDSESSRIGSQWAADQNQGHRRAQDHVRLCLRQCLWKVPLSNLLQDRVCVRIWSGENPQ